MLLLDGMSKNFLERTAKAANIARVNTTFWIAHGAVARPAVIGILVEFLHTVLHPIQKIDTEVFGNVDILQCKLSKALFISRQNTKKSLLRKQIVEILAENEYNCNKWFCGLNCFKLHVNE